MPKTHDLDPRIAATGGRRARPTDPKSEYTWPGMMAWGDWRKTRVHQATAYYGCAKCGARFGSPNAVYAHLGKVHPAGGSRLRLAPLDLSEVPTGGNGHVGSTGRENGSSEPVPSRKVKAAA